MSRYWDGGDGENYPNEYQLFQANVERALKGKRGKKALAFLKEALENLPEKKLIAGALCTIGRDEDEKEDIHYILEERGEGVCAVGAYAWWTKVKQGLDPEKAFEALPTLDDENSEIWETAEYAKSKTDLVYGLAWEIAYRNDEYWGTLTSEQRYDKFIEWIDKELASGKTN